jgi:catechol-2,3-dioxygenase
MFTKDISEIVLIVQDVLAATRFYQEVVGLQPLGETDQYWAWFWTGEPGSSSRIALHKGPLLFEEYSPYPEGERWGHVHYAFEVPQARLEEAAAHVRQQGVEVYGPRHFDWMQAESFYFYDLDGNLLEFWSPVQDEEN